MKKATFLERAKYRFDKSLAAGPIAIIGWLALVSALVVLISALVLSWMNIDTGNEDRSMLENAWLSLMHSLDAGNVASDNGWIFRVIMLLVTIGGIFILSTLIGTISNGITEKIDALRKGRSRVLESNHTLILGWSTKVYSILKELAIANANQKNPRIVILADRDKVEMEDDIRANVDHLGKTQVIVRSGNPLVPTDVEVVSPDEARSIIILSPEEGNADTHVIKSVLALTNGKNRKKEPYHIVAEIREPANMEVAHLVGGEEAVFVMSSDLISRVTAQTCRQSGLSIVYSELLQFDGDEIYFQEEKSLIGKTYKEAISAYETSAVMGIFTLEGEVLINPKMDTILKEGDKIIAISQDDDTVKISNKTNLNIETHKIKETEWSQPEKERSLILGWNERGARIVEELDNYVAAGSEVHILAAFDGLEDEAKKLESNLKNQRLTVIQGDINHRQTLENLAPETFDHIILLSYSGFNDVHEADAKTLVCLLHLRNLSDKAGKDFNIVSEMLDMRNRDLAEVAKADDFIVSDNLISLLLSQLSENKHLKKVYDVLFEAENAEFYLKPASRYVELGTPVNFYTVLESASRKSETALGYRLMSQSEDVEKHYGVALNPLKSNAITFGPEDKVIVLSED